MVNSTLKGEAADHVAETRAAGQTDKLNGYTPNTITSEVGPLDILTPRDRVGSCEPQLVGKRERELSSGLDKQSIALYAQGNSPRIVDDRDAKAVAAGLRTVYTSENRGGADTALAAFKVTWGGKYGQIVSS